MALGGQLRTTDETSLEIFGAIKAIPTGVLISGNTIEVQIGDHIIPAQSCYPFPQQQLPTQKWLDRYAGKIFLWVMFEDALPNKAVWIGWNFIDGQDIDDYTFPDCSVRRQTMFDEVFDESDDENTGGSWSVYQLQDSKQYIQILKSLVNMYAEELNVSVKNKATFSSTTHVIASDEVYLTSEEDIEPGVLGTQLNNNLTQLLGQIASLLTVLNTFAEAMALAAATAPLTPLAAGFTALSTGVTPIITEINTITLNLQNQLSEKVKLS